MATILKIDWKILNDYIEKKLIEANKHPEYDIWILNYTPTTQFERAWDDYTLSCRGLVIDADGNILARPFRKFKNYEEHDPSEIDLSKAYEVYEKMDGSLGILFYYKPKMKWLLATRGSFTSEQAVEGKIILDCMHSIIPCELEYTYLFEIIYPENRIVVNYGEKRDLVLLTIVDTKSGNELPYNEIVLNYSKYFTIVKRYNVKNVNDLNTLRELGNDNMEGFVVKFPNGFRVKVKLLEYCRLHSIITNVSNIVIWKHMKEGLPFEELLDKVPDEFYNWVLKTIEELQNKYHEIECPLLKEFVEIYYFNGCYNRAKFAEHVMASKSKHKLLLFSIYDGKKYSHVIWRAIRPTFSKPFRDGYDTD